MKLLDKKEASFIAAAEYSNKTCVEIAKELKIPSHVSNRLEQKLLKNEVLGPAEHILATEKLGYTHYSVFVAIGAKNERPVKSILQTLERSNNVTWIYLTAGIHQIGFSLTSSSAKEADHQLKNLLTQFEKSIVDSSLSVQLKFLPLGHRFLGAKERTQKATTRRKSNAPSPTDQIDEKDLKILNSMSNNRTVNLNQISRLVGFPLSTVARRVKQLEDNGIISGYQRRINLTPYGYSTFLILLKVRTLSEQTDKRVQEFAHKLIPATFLVSLLGAWQYEIGVVLQSPLDITAIVQEIYCDLGDIISSVEVVQVLSYVKRRNVIL